MIADWTVDVGPESAVMVLPWEGWVDLRRDVLADRQAPWPAERAAELPEAARYPELLRLLEAGNGRHTWTAKVDVFAVTREEVDPEIAELGAAATACGLCSYLDLLSADGLEGFAAFEQAAREAAAALRRMALPLAATVEIVVRPAQLYDRQTFGWTVYAAGFGADEAGARAAWSRAAELALEAAVESIARADEALGAARTGRLCAAAAATTTGE